jgi:hypothetical protein
MLYHVRVIFEATGNLLQIGARFTPPGPRSVVRGRPLADAGYESRKLARELKRRHTGGDCTFSKRRRRAFKVVGLTWIVERTFAWLSQKSI